MRINTICTGTCDTFLEITEYGAAPVISTVAQYVPVRTVHNRCARLTTLPLSCADYLEIWEPQSPGTLRACPGLYRDFFTYSM